MNNAMQKYNVKRPLNIIKIIMKALVFILSLLSIVYCELIHIKGNVYKETRTVEDLSTSTSTTEDIQVIQVPIRSFFNIRLPNDVQGTTWSTSTMPSGIVLAARGFVAAGVDGDHPLQIFSFEATLSGQGTIEFVRGSLRYYVNVNVS